MWCMCTQFYTHTDRDYNVRMEEMRQNKYKPNIHTLHGGWNRMRKGQIKWMANKGGKKEERESRRKQYRGKFEEWETVMDGW